MQKLLSSASSIILSLGLVFTAYIIGKSIEKRNYREELINVTGSGYTNFESDLIVWEGSFSQNNYDLQRAYANLSNHKTMVENYLVSKGISRSEIIFTAVNSRKNTKPIYTNNGNYIGDEFMDYTLFQGFKIESKEVKEIEKIAREVTELLNKGVQLDSKPPRYYYTKLADLKIDLIAKATEDGRQRAETIADKAGNYLGKLKKSDMGIFQITGQNSDENYSWGGTFNTSDKNKTASITVKLSYKID